jgi:hypothetical protein
MMMNRFNFNRRRFLRGAAGAVVALPFLESLAPRETQAGGSSPRFFFAMRQANGVQTSTDSEPDRFWPSSFGALTTAGMQADSERAVGELADYADKLLIVAGTRFGFPGNGCGHSGGGNQCLTAARVSDVPAGNESLSMGESVDNRIATQLNDPGVDPLTLYVGKKNGYIDEVLSYRGPMDLRGADENPWVVYEKLFGLVGTDSELIDQIKARRASVNDLVTDEMDALLSSPKLSGADYQRLQLHRDAIREIELDLTCSLPPDDEVAAIEAMAAFAQDNDNVEVVARMQADLIALAFACELTHAATLQIGDGNDGTEYTVAGQKLPNYHMISHRIFSHGSDGDPIPGAEMMHHEIDRIHARMFKHLLDRLTDYTLPTGESLLDQTVALWTNDLANRYHSYTNVPQVIAGSGGGYLRQGQYVDAGNVTHNKLFNTILNAVGCTKDDGTPVDDFGDSSLEAGEIVAMKA